MDISHRFVIWTDRLRAIARIGLNWNSDYFDRERYMELLDIASQMATVLNPEIDTNATDRLYNYWLRQVQQDDVYYVTPQVSVAAAVFDQEGRVLLVKRVRDGWWDLPAGWCDVGRTAAQTVAREVLQETGLVVTPIHLLGLYDSTHWDFQSPLHSFNLLFYCQLKGGVLKVQTAEISEADFFQKSQLPTMLPGALPGLERAIAFRRGEIRDTYFDP